MIPYLLLLFFVTGVAYLGRRSGHKLIRRTSLVVVGGALVLYAGLRDYRVGMDTGNYVHQFRNSESFASVVGGHNEVGYNFLSWLARSASDSYSVLLLLIATLVVGCYLPTIVKLTRRYETALFLFITLGVYTFFFNGARQGIAAAICFAALPFLLQRRAWPYFLMVGFATLFHKTAFVALPLYFLAAPRVSALRLGLLAAAAVVLVVFLRVFVGFVADFLDDKYAAYAEAGEGGGTVMLAFLLVQGAVLLVLKGTIRQDQRALYCRLLNIYLIGLVIAVAAVVSNVNPSGLLRLHVYFSSMAILLWPIVFQQFSTTALRGLVAVGFLVVTVAFFAMTTSAFSNLAPYRINSTYALP